MQAVYALGGLCLISAGTVHLGISNAISFTSRLASCCVTPLRSNRASRKYVPGFNPKVARCKLHLAKPEHDSSAEPEIVLAVISARPGFLSGSSRPAPGERTHAWTL
jgi:hypothetical protein